MELVQSKKNPLKYKIVDKGIKMGWALFQDNCSNIFKLKIGTNLEPYDLYKLYMSVWDIRKF